MKWDDENIKVVFCDHCDGVGYLTVDLGHSVERDKCPVCDGKGHIVVAIMLDDDVHSEDIARATRRLNAWRGAE